MPAFFNISTQSFIKEFRRLNNDKESLLGIFEVSSKYPGCLQSVKDHLSDNRPIAYITTSHEPLLKRITDKTVRDLLYTTNHILD